MEQCSGQDRQDRQDMILSVVMWSVCNSLTFVLFWRRKINNKVVIHIVNKKADTMFKKRDLNITLVLKYQYLL